jgi:DNA polymerase elongation subunit (family B)
MEHQFRIFDFNVFNNIPDSEDSDSVEDEAYTKPVDKNEFAIQIFGINEKRETCSIIAEDFKPFFYIKVGDNWNIKTKEDFVSHLRGKMKPFYKNSLINSKIIKKKKLYGFDGGKFHKFIKLEFENIQAMNQVRNFWYTGYKDKDGKEINNTLIKDKNNKLGYIYKNPNTKQNTYTEIYESNIPPLLRFFHLKEISPSGWIELPKKHTKTIRNNKTTHCKNEFIISYKNIIPLNQKETRVPLKICSMDIEASSSHGDFPIPIKSYKKLATDIIEYFEKDSIINIKQTKGQQSDLFKKLVLHSFGYNNEVDIAIVYPKQKPTETAINKKLNNVFKIDKATILNVIFEQYKKTKTQKFYKKQTQDEDEDEEESSPIYKRVNYLKNTRVINDLIDVLYDKKCSRNIKIDILNSILDEYFPKLEGDKVTFIGSTFMNYGDSEPKLNHCIVLDTCSKLPINNCVIESYKTEKEVLLAWQKVIQREDPDIIIGYNIFGFDYPFMFHRAEENDCVEEFLQLSRNKNEICGTYTESTGKYDIESSSITIASGTHELKRIKMNGRIQVDLYNYYRRESNLISYKLDSVAGHFIGDMIIKCENIEYEEEEEEEEEEEDNKATIIYSSNLTGLLEGSYIHIEEIGHSVEYYDSGKKFIVTEIDNENKTFTINCHITPNMAKRVRWCLAKDDVTPKDIFRLTNGSANDRAIIAKYCIQDCNLVHYLFKKSDVLTGYIEMSKICSVPIDFLVMRGQGIKLTSYIAKKCRDMNTLMPVINKGSEFEAYEGAIVLPPKCDLYLDNPVACVDYASLYPSSMISENLSHDSKVWSKEYDLENNLIEITGERDKEGNFVYDNLIDYEYVNKTYDTYKYILKPNGVKEKVLCGTKTCRFAQFQEGNAIMPSILKELLAARKATRKQIPTEKDEFMKQVLEQRQLGYKLTANSLYGQCGAKTSTFYEKDIAACTTATGRMLLIYARRIIEETYGNKICNTKNHGPVLSKAEYIYGDTDSVFFTFNLHTTDGIEIRGRKALEITIELAQEAGKLASIFLKEPHDLEYEKTFMPFCLLSKKRYIGMLYEMDPDKGKRKEMGIVLKRRDNAPIVKDIYGGVIEILMKEKDIQKSIDFLNASLQNIVDENVPIEKLIITKSLRSGYKKPQSIAHNVLANRIGEREQGNKPCSGDRIPYVFIHTKSKSKLQGEKIETPSFIIKNKLKIDYSFYITNQIMNPLLQVYALVLEQIWKKQKKLNKIKNFKNDISNIIKNTPLQKQNEKIEKLRLGETKKLLFDNYLRKTNNKKQGQQPINSFFVIQKNNNKTKYFNF